MAISQTNNSNHLSVNQATKQIAQKMDIQNIINPPTATPQTPQNPPESTNPPLRVVKPLPTFDTPSNRTPREIFLDFIDFEIKHLTLPKEECEEKWRIEKNISDDDWNKYLAYQVEREREALEEKKSEEQRKFKEKQRRISEIIKTAKIPTRFRNKLAKDFVVTDSNQNIVECLKAVRNNQGFYIYGECGTGKTLLASIIQNERAHQLKPSTFICATDIFSELNPYSSNAENVINKLNLLKSTPCLIIDDLGVEKPTERVKQNLFDIINYRYNEELQTIITSNFSLEELALRISGTNRTESKYQKIADYEGDRIIRRIKAICNVIEVKHY